MNLKFFIFAVLVGAIIGFGITYLTLNKNYDNQLLGHKETLTKCQNKVANFCNGQTLGGLRLNTIVCNNKQELCICGDPARLQSGM